MGVYDDEDAEDDPYDEAEEPRASSPRSCSTRLREAVGGEKALDELDTGPLPEEPFAWDAVPADVHARVGEVLDLVERCCAELLDDEYRTACRRLLADAAAGDPQIFRRRGKAEMTAAAVCWIAGKANALFDPTAPGPTMQVKQLMAHFGLVTSASQRSAMLLRAIGVEPDNRYVVMSLGTPRYLTGARRAQILDDRERFRAMAD